jgi:hypothetical protein
MTEAEALAVLRELVAWVDGEYAPDGRPLWDRARALLTPDPSEPWPVSLPPEPPRDRVIEAVDAEGAVVFRWKWGLDGDDWVSEGPDGMWPEILIAAIARRWSLRSVPAEGGGTDDRLRI